MVKLPCSICGGSEFRTVQRQLRDRVWHKPGTFQLQACTACGLVHTRPRPSDEGLATYYEETYSAGEEPAKRAMSQSAIFGLFHRQRLALIETGGALGPQDHLVDVGCSFGGFLCHVVPTGAALTGVDTDEGSIAGTLAPDTVRLVHGRLEELGLPEGSATVVTILQVLEHVPHPRATLAEIRRILAPGGRLLVEVPRHDSPWRVIFGRFWFPLLPPQPLHHFSRATLIRLLQAEGFTVAKAQSLFAPLEGVASLALLLVRAFRMPPPGSPFTWRTPFDWAVVAVILALFFLVEIPSQALLWLVDRTGHQMVLARSPLPGS